MTITRSRTATAHAICVLTCIFSMGCQTRSDTAKAAEAPSIPDADAQSLLELLREPEHHVVLVPGNDPEWDELTLINYGRVMPMVKPSRSGVIEHHFIDDRSNKAYLAKDPLLLMPMLEWRDQSAALTALHVYHKIVSTQSQHFKPEFKAGDWVMPDELRPQVSEKIRVYATKHPDPIVRLRCIGFIAVHDQITIQDLDHWLGDPSLDVRYFTARIVSMGAMLCRPPAQYRGIEKYGSTRQAGDYLAVLIKHLYHSNIGVSELMYDAIYSVFTQSIGIDYLQHIEPPGISRGALFGHQRWANDALQVSNDQRALQKWWDNGGREQYEKLAAKAITEGIVEPHPHSNVIHAPRRYAD